MATLITTIGTGQKNEGSKQWEYRQAEYQYKNEEPVQTSYIGKAILESSLGSRIERIVVFGTPSTGWGNLISGFGLEDDDESVNLWQELKCVEENARENKSLGVDTENLNALRSLLEKKLGLTINLYLTPIAIDETKIWDFLSKLTEVILNLPPDEEIYIDITHGLRHHHVFMASTLGFINQLALNSSRTLHLLYGAFQQQKENISPILELSAINKMHQWSRALSAFIRHGDYEELANLISVYNFKEAQNLVSTLETLSFEVAGNYVFLLKNGETGSLSNTLQLSIKHIDSFLRKIERTSEVGELVAVKYILDELKKWVTQFATISDPVTLLFALAKDHIKRRRYLLALTSCYEGLRIFQARITGLDHYEKGNEKLMWEAFNKALKSVAPDLSKRFHKTCIHSGYSLRTLRNQIVHCLPSDREKHISAKGLKKHVTKLVKETIQIIGELQKAGLK